MLIEFKEFAYLGDVLLM